MKTDSRIEKELEQLAYMYKLNAVIRYDFTRDEKYKTQSVSEHITNLLACAYFFVGIITDGHKLDMGLVSRRALLHDMGEIETGDIVTVRKTKEDMEKEHQALSIVAQRVPPVIAKTLISDVEAVENGTDFEGRFVRAMDKFDGLFFELSDDGIEMIRNVHTDIEVRRKYLKGLTPIMVNLGFPEIVPYIRMTGDMLIKRGYLRNED